MKRQATAKGSITALTSASESQSVSHELCQSTPNNVVIDSVLEIPTTTKIHVKKSHVIMEMLAMAHTTRCVPNEQA